MIEELNDKIPEVKEDSLVKLKPFDGTPSIHQKFNDRDAYRVIRIDKMGGRVAFYWLGPKDMSEVDKDIFRSHRPIQDTEVERFREIGPFHLSDLILLDS